LKNVKLTILIIDDEPLFLRSTALLLSSKYRCISASSGEAGLREVEISQPDLVISDVQMNGGISGFDVCDHLKRKDPSLPVILLTNFNDRECRMQGLQSGANDYLGKRVDNEELLQRVENTLILAGKLANRKLARNLGDQTSEGIKGESDQDDRFMEKIEGALRAAIAERKNHIQVGLSLEQIAKRLHITPRTLQRRLQNGSGLTFTGFRQNLLMTIALELLPKDYKLNEIANILDIKSQAYFTALFRKTFGRSPSEYRKSL
jgi:YesN/AraC family two-component response regulator